MNGLVRLAVCSFSLAVCSPGAFADVVSVTGNVNFTADSLTFAPPFATTTNTGVFAPFSGGTVNYLLGTVAYNDGIPQTELAFTITSGSGDVLSFFDQVNSPVKSFDSLGNLDVRLNETGYYSIDGGSAMAGYFDLSFAGNTPNGSAENVQFTGTGDVFQSAMTGVTPEPGSFLLLGTGLLGSAGLLAKRRKAVS